tara:strand:- start:894 stop:1676 length:783 start_codon:yes stop_codon:yes gene_type:complete
MAEVEYKGIKVGGSKLLLIIPLLGTIGGGLWAGFEAYTRYIAMEEKIANFVSPDLSHIDNFMVKTEGKFELLEAEFISVQEILETELTSLKNIDDATSAVIREQVNSIKATAAKLQTDLHDLRMDLNQDITHSNDVLDKSIDKVNSNIDKQEARLAKQDERNRELIEEQEDKLSKQDDRNRQSSKDITKASSDNVTIVRGLIASSEERRDKVVDRLDAKIAETQVLIDNMIKENRKFVDGLKAELDTKIKKALVNPLLGK